MQGLQVFFPGKYIQMKHPQDFCVETGTWITFSEINGRAVAAAFVTPVKTLTVCFFSFGQHFHLFAFA